MPRKQPNQQQPLKHPNLLNVAEAEVAEVELLPEAVAQTPALSSLPSEAEVVNLVSHHSRNDLKT
jgi:hypothetical protein